MDALATTHVMRMEDTGLEPLVLATFVTAPNFAEGRWSPARTTLTDERVLIQRHNGVQRMWVESLHDRDRGAPNTFLATQCDGYIRIRRVEKIRFAPEHSEVRREVSAPEGQRRVVKWGTPVDVRQGDSSHCIDDETWGRLWDFGDGEGVDADAPTMPLGDDSMQLDPVDAKEDAILEANEALEQGFELSETDRTEIAAAVRQHNERLLQNELRCVAKRRRVCHRRVI